MREIFIARNNGWYGKMRKFSIYADDTLLGTIRSGETQSFELPDHARQMFCKIDWAKTNIISAEDIRDGDRFEINSVFSLNPLKLLGIAPIPVTLSKVSQSPAEDIFE